MKAKATPVDDEVWKLNQHPCIDAANFFALLLLMVRTRHGGGTLASLLSEIGLESGFTVVRTGLILVAITFMSANIVESLSLKNRLFLCMHCLTLLLLVYISAISELWFHSNFHAVILTVLTLIQGFARIRIAVQFRSLEGIQFSIKELAAMLLVIAIALTFAFTQ